MRDADGDGDVVMTKDSGSMRKKNHETVQTFMTIKNESKGKDKSIKRTEIRRHAISNR